MKEFEFKCSSCGEIHKGIPTFGVKYPMNVLYVPEEKRKDLVDLGDNECVIDGSSFYLRGCIEIPVHGYDENFIWGAWVLVNKEEFIEYISFPENGDRSTLGPYYGYLNGHFRPYEADCDDLKIIVHPKSGRRPYLELAPSNHLLYQEQKNGISAERVAEIYEVMMHGKG